MVHMSGAPPRHARPATRETRLVEWSLAALCGARSQLLFSGEFSAAPQAVPDERSCCGGLRFAPTPLRYSGSWPVAKLATLTAFAALEQSRRVRRQCALRARPRALRSSAPQKSRAPGTACRAKPVVACGATNTASDAAWRAVPARGDFWGDEQRSAGVGARSALRDLTRRDCPSETNAVSAASFAARPRREQRSGVGAKRRPPQHEPLAGAAGRAAPTRRTNNASQPTTTPDRQQTFPVTNVPCQATLTRGSSSGYSMSISSTATDTATIDTDVKPSTRL